MIDTIHDIAGSTAQEPASSGTGQVDRAKSPIRDRAPREPVATPHQVSGAGARSVAASGDILEVVQDINGLLREVAATKVVFDVDEATGRSIVRVVNKETGEVLRQVPPEELLTLVARMEQLSGLIFNQEA